MIIKKKLAGWKRDERIGDGIPSPCVRCSNYCPGFNLYCFKNLTFDWVLYIYNRNVGKNFQHLRFQIVGGGRSALKIVLAVQVEVELQFDSNVMDQEIELCTIGNESCTWNENDEQATDEVLAEIVNKLQLITYCNVTLRLGSLNLTLNDDDNGIL